MVDRLFIDPDPQEEDDDDEDLDLEFNEDIDPEGPEYNSGDDMRDM